MNLISKCFYWERRIEDEWDIDDIRGIRIDVSINSLHHHSVLYWYINNSPQKGEPYDEIKV